MIGQLTVDVRCNELLRCVSLVLVCVENWLGRFL